MPNLRCFQLAKIVDPVHSQEFGRRIPFAFLEDVREKYMAKFSDAAQSAPAYAHISEFSQVHLSHMQGFQLVQPSLPSYDMQCYMRCVHVRQILMLAFQYSGA